jgi:hypothetical protein
MATNLSDDESFDVSEEDDVDVDDAVLDEVSG